MADEDEQDLRETFLKASNFMKTIAGNLDSSKLLFFYSHYKQSNEGPCNVPKPGFFDFQGKQKWEAWNKLGKMSKQDAMLQYIDEVSNQDPDWEDKMDSGEVKPKAGMGLAVSTMANDEEEIDDADKTIFDWCKDGDTQKINSLLSNRNINVNEMDEEGMTLLHWASDRGNSDMVSALIKNKASVNSRDNEGQTPLHYAVSCEHIPVIELLLNSGVDRGVTDNDGESAASLTTNKDILKLLEAA